MSGIFGYFKKKSPQVLKTEYVSSRILLVPFPIQSYKPLLVNYLKQEHKGEALIWNLSEYQYNTENLEFSVLDYVYQGYPIPPLKEIFSICKSIQAWLTTSQENIAVVHCQASQIRSRLITACYMYWVQRAKKSFPGALDFQPSQKRYAEYFKKVSDGDFPVKRRLIIQRIIMSPMEWIENGRFPYIQVFKDQEMIFASVHYTEYQRELPISVQLNLSVDGDFLVRCRHCHEDKKQTLFRFMINTSFIQGQSLRLIKDDLDFGCQDQRFGDDFFCEVFFSENKIEENQAYQQFWEGILQKEDGREIVFSDQEEKIDVDLIEKYKSTVDQENSDDEAELDDYFKQLEDS